MKPETKAILAAALAMVTETHYHSLSQSKIRDKEPTDPKFEIERIEAAKAKRLRKRRKRLKNSKL